MAARPPYQTEPPTKHPTQKQRNATAEITHWTPRLTCRTQRITHARTAAYVRWTRYVAGGGSAANMCAAAAAAA